MSFLSRLFGCSCKEPEAKKPTDIEAVQSRYLGTSVFAQYHELIKILKDQGFTNTESHE